MSTNENKQAAKQTLSILLQNTNVNKL